MTAEMKTCSKCKSEKPETDFYLRSVVTGKRRADCKECLAAEHKVYREGNQDKLAAKRKLYCAENRKKVAAQRKSYYEENREKIKAFYKENREDLAAQRRVRNYGVTPDAFKRMLANQGGVCAICGSGEKGKWLSVDHDHKTGKVRGLLCSMCNKGIGHLKDSSDIACRVADYLKKHGL